MAPRVVITKRNFVTSRSMNRVKNTEKGTRNRNESTLCYETELKVINYLAVLEGGGMLGLALMDFDKAFDNSKVPAASIRAHMMSRPALAFGRSCCSQVKSSPVWHHQAAAARIR